MSARACRSAMLRATDGPDLGDGVRQSVTWAADAQVGRQQGPVVELVVGAQHELRRHTRLREHGCNGPADGGARLVRRHDDADVNRHRSAPSRARFRAGDG